MSLSYSWTTLLLCVDLFLPVQISISSVFFPCHTLSRASCFAGLVFHSQCGFTILSQSRGQIGSHSYEIRHGSLIRYNLPIHNRHGFHSRGLD